MNLYRKTINPEFSARLQRHSKCLLHLSISLLGILPHFTIGDSLKDEFSLPCHSTHRIIENSSLPLDNQKIVRISLHAGRQTPIYPATQYAHNLAIWSGITRGLDFTKNEIIYAARSVPDKRGDILLQAVAPQPKLADNVQLRPLQITGFIILIVLALLLILAGVNYNRSRRLKINNKRLAHMVQLRTESIERQKLELEQNDAIKSKLLSVISHDLRSPLSSLKGLLELLDAGALSPEEFVGLSKDIDDQVNNLISLMDNLLTWIKSQMQGIELKKGNVNLFPLVEENLRLFRTVAIKKGIVLYNQIPRDTKIFADPDMLKLVLRNLLANAIKFTYAGGEVKVSVYEYHHELVICVSDTGIGMNQEQQEKLFHLHTQNSVRGTANEIGNGLGLILCKEFIEISGGKIWVESVPKKGSTFKFTIEKFQPNLQVRLG